jgi:hypothetical protein
VATQWFVVSDLGLSTMSGKDGLHVGLRSIATADPLADVEVRLIARNNDILATAKSDATGTVIFAPGLLKGEGGLSPALVVAQSAASDYSFVDLTQPAFDLTDRGVDGRAPSGNRRFRLCRTRRLSPWRNHATVPCDDAANALSGTPVTVVEPDGVNTSPSRSMTERRRAFPDFAINALAQGGTWRIKALTDPNGETTARRPRSRTMCRTARVRSGVEIGNGTVGEGATFAIDGRYLFSAPAAGLDLGSLSITADGRPFAVERLSVRPMDERIDTIRRR